MRNTCLVAVLVGILTAASASMAVAQTEDLILLTDVHVRPTMGPQYEAALLKGVALLEEREYPFTRLIIQSDRGVYRTVTFLPNGWEDRARSDAWFDQFSSPPAFVADLNAASSHTDSSIHRARPDLATNPENPRVPLPEWGIMREIRFYLRRGAQDEATEVLEQMAEVYARHNHTERRIVNFLVTGSDGPRLSILLPARDPVDWYTQSAKTTEMLGAEITTLRQRLNGLARRVEWVNWTPREDLAYRPAN